jgi:hypothetical protein
LDKLRKDLKEPAQDAPETMIAKKGTAAKALAGKPLNAWVLEYKFDKNMREKVADATGKSGPGLLKGVSIVDGQHGSPAAKFDGQAYIEVPKVKSLNPAVGAWIVEVVFKSDKPDGVILAQGGEANGYNLWLENGKLRFTVVGAATRSDVKSDAIVTGQWVTVRAGFDSSNVLMSVNGETVIKSPLKQTIERMPADGFQIGADLGSQVLGDEHPDFTGLIESVRVFSGNEPD